MNSDCVKDTNDSSAVCPLMLQLSRFQLRLLALRQKWTFEEQQQHHFVCPSWSGSQESSVSSAKMGPCCL
jgi:hypothetical protein